MAPQRRSTDHDGITFDRRVTIGNIFSILTVIFSMMAGCFMVLTRLAVIETRLTHIEKKLDDDNTTQKVILKNVASIP